jgi:hypothetical protein
MNQVHLGPNSKDIKLNISLDAARPIFLGGERPIYTFDQPEDIKSSTDDLTDSIAMKSLWRSAAFLSQETSRAEEMPTPQTRAMDANLLVVLGELGVVDIPNPGAFLAHELGVNQEPQIAA